MQKQKNKQRGITLIALVVTVIVLIILAGVSIAMLVGENGIITQAQTAKEETKNASLKEELSIKVVESLNMAGKIDIEKLNSSLAKVDGLTYNEEKISNNNKIKKLPVMVEIEGSKLGILINGEIIRAETIENIMNVIYVKENTLVRDINEKYFVIPEGFTIRVDESTENAQSIEDGIVIEDYEGNQYVWIAVEGILGEEGKNIQNAIEGEVILGRYVFDNNGTINTTLSPKELDGELKTGSGTEYGYKETTVSNGNAVTNNIENFINSVRKNGGYYIARFEASRGEEGKVESKYNASVWNNITQINAVAECNNMYETDDVNSELINSYAWDTAILFIQKNGQNNYSRQESLNTETDGLLNTGMSGDKQCNVYDMASNCREWTTETYTNPNSPCTNRGGFYIASYSYTNSRNASNIENYSEYHSFRPIL